MIDPVCGMKVDPARAAGSVDYKGLRTIFVVRIVLKNSVRILNLF